MQTILNEPGSAECVYPIRLLPFANDFCSEKAGLCVNVYDVRLKDEIPACGLNWPTDLVNITSYLRVRSLLQRCSLITHLRKQRPDVLNALHAQGKSEAWVECHSRVGRELGSATDPSSVTVLPRVLEKIPVLLFAGDQDFICNYLGQESLIQALTWNGGTGLGVRSGFPLSTTNIIIFDRKWKLKLGLLATPPREHGSPRGI